MIKNKNLQKVKKKFLKMKKTKKINLKERTSFLKKMIKEIKVLKIRKNHLVIPTTQSILIKNLMKILKR